jgi:sugar fermentation stimulation protein A
VPPSVPIPGPLAEARFVARPNRFVVRARLGGDEVAAHLPDPGRLRELLLPGRRIWLRPAPVAGRRGRGGPGGRRRTAWTAVLAESPEGGGLVSLDTTLPNRLVAEALRRGALTELAGWRLERAEATVGASRFDFLLAAEGEDRRCVLEVKSVTLVADGTALFPDAVSARGARHVRELAALAGRPGWAAAVLFVVQRPDARRVLAAREIDPRFADALAAARKAGVRILGRRCRVDLDRVTLGDPLPAG